ncbi:efflux RND transporter periplasmic adaptor subunit [Lujinxingia vulgaris]|uniref:Efflux RND transporter periplasmic adaptor subunit n=2 Tax=Lujinxingia vulgaris TaxID=2600176 RepID=A0A5C6X9E6_9DELT|nr:efflux RND transporter periplasmic adaptor subunit [Lujinxingia vulgaris]
MKTHLLPLIVCALVMGTGCDTSVPPEHPEESHKSHADHDEHEGEEHNHQEHGAGHEESGAEAGHPEENHDDATHDEASHADEESVVTLSPEALESSSIVIGNATAGVVTGAFEVPAEVQHNPDLVAHISPLVEGQLLSVDALLGDRVDSGDKLARLRSVELGQARAELSRTTSMRNVAEENLARQRQLRAENINSQRSLLEAELAYEQADAERDAALSRLRVFGLEGGSGPDMALLSPIDGVVVERHATRGENVSPDDTLFIVANLSRVWVIGRVYEQNIAEVAEGMNATLTLNAYPGRTWTGTVDFVGARLDEATRSLPIRVEIDNPNGLLRPGLFGSLRLASGEPKGSSVVVPLSAVQTLDNRTVVFVPGDAEGEFEARPVTLGRESDDQAEVLEGLQPGTPIVVNGAFIIKSQLMRGELGHGHAH